MPERDQDVLLYWRTKGDDCFGGQPGMLYLFANTDQVRARVARANKGGPLIIHEFGDVAGVWQGRTGALWDHGHQQYRFPPFFPPRQAIECFTPDQTWCVSILRSDGVLDRAACDRCPMEARMMCHAHGGINHVVDTLSKHPAIVNVCEYAHAALAHANPLLTTSSYAAQNSMRIWGQEESVKNGKDDQVTLQDLVGAGFWVSNRLNVFTWNMGMNVAPNDVQIDHLVMLADAGAMDCDIEDAAKMARELGVSFNAGDLDFEKLSDRDRIWFGDLVFSADHVRASVVANRVARLESARAARSRAAIKREHCKACVYDCRRHLGACTLTEADIVGAYRGVDREKARAWMASFAWSGTRRDRGRSHLITWGPVSNDVHAPLVFATRRLNASTQYPRGPDLAPEDFNMAQMDDIIDCISQGEEQEAYLFHALRSFWHYGHFSAKRVYFRKFKKGEKGFPTRNDVLYISIKDIDEKKQRMPIIEIGSDTKAAAFRSEEEPGATGDYKSNGFRTIWFGDRISHHKRPRFKTTYTFPYVENILEWTGEPLGSPKAPLRIIR